MTERSMVALSVKSFQSAERANWQEGFLKMLPLIEKQARVAFRELTAEAQEDAVAEVVANAMCAYRRLHERGELQRAFASALTRYAVAQYRVGRRVGTPHCSNDVYAHSARPTTRNRLRSLESASEEHGDWREYLIDNRQTPVPSQVAFRLDFPSWLERLTPRNRQIAQQLALGHSTGDVAQEFRISPARISQLRRELADSWYAFIRTVLEESESGGTSPS